MGKEAIERVRSETGVEVAASVREEDTSFFVGKRDPRGRTCIGVMDPQGKIVVGCFSQEGLQDISSLADRASVM
jgi:hypothetical protein